MKRTLIIAVVLIAVVVAAGAYWFMPGNAGRQALTLYGNVDLRQVSLAFNSRERVKEVLVDEGDFVRAGDPLARLDAKRLELQLAEAEAQTAAMSAAVERLRNGSRPEEIDQARANLASAEANAVNARLQHERLVTLLGRSLTSEQEVDSAKATLDAAEANERAARLGLELQIAGPRDEDIAQAQAQLQASEANAALLRQVLEDATLTAPVNGVVRSRLLEPGDMASPERPVFSIAIVDRKWVRAYVTEVELGRIREGTDAYVEVDAFPRERFPGQVGFISSVAEFTPKSVQTEALRTSLVYEVRVQVEDPDNRLRLGMPATVRVSLDRTETG